MVQYKKVERDKTLLQFVVTSNDELDLWCHTFQWMSHANFFYLGKFNKEMTSSRLLLEKALLKTE